MIKNIVFDLGGVIAHLVKERSIERFEQIGVHDISKILDAYVQTGIFLAVEDGSLSKEEFRVQLSKHAGRELTHDEIYWAYMGFVAEIPQYKLDYIENLKNEYNIYILSNTNPYIMEFSESRDFSKKGLPLSHYYHKKFASFEMGAVKPDRKIFEKMIEETGLIPQETLFVDDGPQNIAIGKELGFITYQPNNFEDWRWNITRILEKHK